jgi:uncharacterized protein YecA (UPF0149 family)
MTELKPHGTPAPAAHSHAPVHSHADDACGCGHDHHHHHHHHAAPFTMRRLEPKVGRNDPCPCGSGSKYKKCCLAA